MNQNIKLSITHKNLSVKSDIEKGQEIFNSKMRSFVEKTESICNEMERIIKSSPYSNLNQKILNDVLSLQAVADHHKSILGWLDSGSADMSFYNQPWKSETKEVTILKTNVPQRLV